MGVYFKTKDGKQGMLDVAMMLRADGLVPYKVENGNVLFTDETNQGRKGMFSIADWAVKNEYSVTKVDGFNTPPTALDVPPLDLTRLDQSVWYMNGAKTDALQEIYSQVTKLDDGRVVVLDKDGLWKTMWSDLWAPDQEYPTYEDRVQTGESVDTRSAMRAAGMAFLFGITGVDPKFTKGTQDVTPDSIEKVLEVLNRNAPMETQMALGQLVQQTTGLDPWKFSAILDNADDVSFWLKDVMKKTSFEFRMLQGEHAELLVAALHKVAINEFSASMNALIKTPAAKTAVIDAGQAAMEFLAMLQSMDVIRDLSKITGLDDWKNEAKDIVNIEDMPPMPAFVPRLVKLLEYILPMAKDKNLKIAKGPRGLKAIGSLLVILDSCLYSLSEVPDSTAKQKMFMVLKGLQTKFESKMCMAFHPVKNDDGMKTNAFMQAKAIYTEKREVVYKLVQTPKEAWAKVIIETVKEEPNLPAFLDLLPEFFAKTLKSFIALDVAYDMQPWVDANYQDRILDSFAVYQDAYGPPPPEYGYLASNSPRAALNIIDTLATAAGMIGAISDKERKAILRSPIMFANLMKMIQTASVGREIGAAEILSRFGFDDPYASPTSTEIWRDPNEVQAENDMAEQEVMAMMEQQVAAQEQEKLAQAAPLPQATLQGGEGAEEMPPDQKPGAAKRGGGSQPMSGAANGGSEGAMSTQLAVGG